MNQSGGLYCARCSMALNEDAAMEIENTILEAQNSDEYEILYERIKRDLMAEKESS